MDRPAPTIQGDTVSEAVVGPQIGNAHFAVLGSLTLHTTAGELCLGPLKQRLLLAMLLCRPNSPVRVETLTDALWDGAAPRTARKNLQVYISALRRLLDDAGLTDRLALRPGGYVLGLADVELDSLRFQSLVRAGRRAAAHGELARAAALLRAALDLWQGPPLPELRCSRTVHDEAERLALRYPPVYEDWAETELRLGRPVRVAETVADLVELHPERERLRAAQMQALFRLGRQTEALAAYEELRQHLAAEFGLEPSPVLAAQYYSILTGTSAEPTGRVQKPAEPARTPVPSLLLPRELPDFVGREQEVSGLLAALDTGPDNPGRCRLAVLTGPVGVGKTVTAVRVAHRLAARYPDGCLLVRMRDDNGRIRPLRLVLARLERAGGYAAGAPCTPTAEEEPGAKRAAEWRAWLECSRALVVLDDAVDEAQVRPLVPTAGGSAVLVTACGQLAGLPGACRFHLGPLDTPDALRLLGEIIGAERLAADRLSAERIADATGGLPLALRVGGLKLAALRHLPLGEYAARLEHTPGLLDELSAGDLAVRPQLADYWRGLATARQSALARLCMLPADGFTLDRAAVALGCELFAARADLESLMDAGAIAVPDHEVTSHRAWYQLPRVLWAYAREQRLPPARPAAPIRPDAPEPGLTPLSAGRGRR